MIANVTWKHAESHSAKKLELIQHMIEQKNVIPLKQAAWLSHI